MSVITPAYMAEEFIAETMRSVWAQDYRPMEHIVVDDCSPDRTGEVARSRVNELHGPDYSVRVLRMERNGGTAAALTRGIEDARGELISWLSADDLFVSPHKTARQVAAMSDPHLSGVFDWASMQGPSTRDSRIVRSGWPRLLRLDRGLRQLDPPQTLVGLLFANPINGTSILLRREVLDEVGPFDPVLGTFDQDADLWLRMQALGLRFAGMDEPGTLYRIHPGQNSNNTARMEHGTSMSRIRALLALRDAGRLEETLESARTTLALGASSGLHRNRPAVFAALAEMAPSDSRGSVHVTLRAIRRDLLRARPVSVAEAPARIEQARALMDSGVYTRFRDRLSDRG